MNPTILIDPTPDGDGAPRVEALLAPYAEMFGQAPDALRLLGVSPPILENYSRNIGYFMEHPRLSMPLLAMIRYLVSSDGRCRYCIDFNAAMLIGGGIDADTLERARDDMEALPFEPRERALLTHVIAEVRRPGALTGEAVAELRAHGWSDRDLFDAVYHAHTNRAFGNVMESFQLHAEGTL